ncbi:MAG: Holliday junction resolvase RuvX [Bacteroidales bacterium]|nr:Holliday junction resolvase RuvX [Bacteroidales bacterium]
MSRILSIDYGRKRTGLAVTDSLQLIANGLTTVPTHELEPFLTDYFRKEQVERVVMGLPRQMNGRMSESWQYIEPFLNRLHKLFPQLPIELVDERFTSVLAHQAILESGVGRQRRREDKGMVDTISATIILQSYLENRTMPGFHPLRFPQEKPEQNNK